MSICAIAFDPDKRCWLRFDKPVSIFSTHTLDDVTSILTTVEEATANTNLWAVGWLSYEAAPAFDPSLTVKSDTTFPKVWFATFQTPISSDHLPSTESDTSLQWAPSVSEHAYATAVREIREAIRVGDTYQTNYSFRLISTDPVDPLALFSSMVRTQGGDYNCFIHTGDLSIASASPELFFKREGSSILCRPMKGTAPRGCTLEEDRAIATSLQNSPKNRAENIMIVDMTRNDLSRVATQGSVKVPAMCTVEKYPHMYQMTSDVTAKSTASLVEILRALFPAASITGAPKDETMRIIAHHEDTPRKIYTGAVGVLSPGNRAWFNVAIRTALVDHAAHTTEYGIGSGIVWDSTSASEYRECIAKAAAITTATPPYNLFETILWEPTTGFFLEDRHLDRISKSAEYLGWHVDTEAARLTLQQAHATCCIQGAPKRVRLILAPTGTFNAEISPLQPLPNPYRVSLAKEPVASNNRTLYHKTTDRRAYDNATPSIPGAHDVILWNERGEITESRIANICLEIDGALYTPPIRSGLLAGCYRQWLLDTGRASERILTIKDLQRASRIIFVNSLRREWPVELLHDEETQEFSLPNYAPAKTVILTAVDSTTLPAGDADFSC